MSSSPLAWCYDSNGTIYHAGKIHRVQGTRIRVELLRGYHHRHRHMNGVSEVTVTLSGGTVTFAHDGSEVHSFELPENCGRVSLAVSVCDGGQVTLLSQADVSRSRIRREMMKKFMAPVKATE